MNKLTYFQLTWVFLFFLPIILTIFDQRMFFLSIWFLIFEIWRTWSHFFGGEWVPTPQRIVNEMLKLAKVGSRDIVYDLGSGDGKIVLSSAKLGAKSIGIELDPIRVWMSRIKIKLAGLQHKARIELGNIYFTSIKDASVITLFLLPKTMAKLENKLRKELRKGTRIVSYKFVFEKWKPEKIDKENSIYLYKV